MTCIICRESTSQFSDEHVIPESLGGYYHIYNVCVKCNSKLGNKVDEPLTNHVLAKIFRLEHQIKGKTGHLPNPLNNDAYLIINGKKARKARSQINNEGKIDMTLVPEVDSVIVDELLLIDVNVDLKEINEIEKILHKVANRAGYKIEERIDINNIIEKNIEDSHISCSMDIDIYNYNYKFGLLKIAYEFACDQLDNYYNDDHAVKISSLLKNVAYQKEFKIDEITEYVKGNIFEKNNIFNCFPILERDKPRHYLSLQYLEKIGTVCFISLYNIFFTGVLLSKKNYFINSDFRILINDFKKNSYSIISNSDVNKKTVKSYKFAYIIKSKEDEIQIIKSNLKHKGEKKGIPSLYDSNGNVLYITFEDYCLRLQDTSLENDSKKQISNSYNFTEEVYVKNFDNYLLQVVGVVIYRTLPTF